MIFETQSTQSPQRTTALNERFQEEAKASSQRADAVFFSVRSLSVQCRRHLLTGSVSSAILCVLCVPSMALCPQCPLC